MVSVNKLTSNTWCVPSFIIQLKATFFFYLLQSFLKSPKLWTDSSDLMHTSHWVSSSWGLMLWLCPAGLWLFRVWHSSLTESSSSCSRLRSCCTLYSCSCRFRWERWDCWDTWRSLAVYRCFSSVTSFSQSRCFPSKTYRSTQTQFWIFGICHSNCVYIGQVHTERVFALRNARCGLRNGEKTQGLKLNWF